MDFALKDDLEILRSLDFDDFLILSLILDGCQNSTISRFLYITPPAVSHRILKYERCFGKGFFHKVGAKKHLSESGREICLRYKKVLCMLLNVSDDFDSKCLITEKGVTSGDGN